MKKNKAKEKNLQQRLWLSACEAQMKAYAPYSRFKVGCALEVENAKQERRIISGCNVENASYGGTICAERTAIVKAVSEGFTKIHQIMIVTKNKNATPPCGLCWQILSEFSQDETLVLLASPKRILKKIPFGKMVPYRFVFKK